MPQEKLGIVCQCAIWKEKLVNFLKGNVCAPKSVNQPIFKRKQSNI